jgi:hypothetical protein
VGTDGTGGTAGTGGNAGTAGLGGIGGRGGVGGTGTPSGNRFAPSTANQPAPILSIGNFADSDVLLVSVSIPNGPAGTTFKLANYTGLTPSYGFNFTGDKKVLNFTGTKAAVNAALATMQVSTGAAQGALDFEVTSSINQPNTYFNPLTNSFYEYVAAPNITFTNARTQAKTKTLNGATGYLTNITTNVENEFTKSYINAQNVWIGASDAAVEGEWRWMDGPEAGIQFWQGGTPAKGGYVTGPFNYAAWATNQPDNAGNAEHYGSTNFRGTVGAWNDLPLNGANIGQGYLVEYTEPVGGWTGVSQSSTAAEVVVDGGIGGAGGAGGQGGDGALGGTAGGTASAGGTGGSGGAGGDGGPGTIGGGTGGTGGTGGGGGTSGTSNPGTAGTAGTAGNNSSGLTGGTGGAGGGGGTGGVV